MNYGQAITLTPHFRGSGLRELVEDMEITLALYLADNSTLLKQVIGNLGTYRFTLRVEHDLEVFALESNVYSSYLVGEISSTHMSTGVVIP